MSTPTKAAEIRELAEKIWLNATSHGHGEPIASQAKAILAILADLDGGGDAPPDPDAHITDQEQYLKAKQERANGVDFDGA